MLLAGMLAMVMTATAPAIAQVLENANQSDSGTVTIGNDVSSGSDNGQTDQVQATDQPEVVAPPPPPKMEMKEEKKKEEPAPVPQKAASPPPPPTEAKTGTPEAKAAPPPPKMEEKKALPKTGGSGSASLLALGAGALLIGGGLLARKIAR